MLTKIVGCILTKVFIATAIVIHSGQYYKLSDGSTMTGTLHDTYSLLNECFVG